MLGVAYAMAAPPGGAQGSSQGLSSMVMLAIMFGIFYFLLIRPQQKKAKEHRALLEALKKGDAVVTAGGIHGKIVSIDDTVVTLEIATGVNIKMNKGYIAGLNK